MTKRAIVGQLNQVCQTVVKSGRLQPQFSQIGTQVGIGIVLIFEDALDSQGRGFLQYCSEPVGLALSKSKPKYSTGFGIAGL